MTAHNPQLVSVVGPTASGKTALSLELAKMYDGEIICADSRTVYRGMNIGTAKPTAQEQAMIPHHLLDVAEPDETLSAAQFKRLAQEAITNVQKRGKLPLFVGGSGLYIDAVLYDFQFPPAVPDEVRRQHAALPLEAAVTKLQQVAPEVAARTDLHNSRRVIRALETYKYPITRSQKLRPDTLVIGILPNKDSMQQVIRTRTERMIQDGLVEEVAAVARQFGWDCPALSGISYRTIRAYLEGEASLEQAVESTILGDQRLVKKQMTWFGRNKDIQWISSPNEAKAMVSSFLRS